MKLFNCMEIKLVTKKNQIKDVLLTQGKLKAMTKYKQLYKDKSLVDAKAYLDKLIKESDL